ncbi:MAG: hypothetical protein Fur0022_15160 [Anaerolineales bacterium]
MNALLHAPNIQYDADEHFRYLETLAQARLPNLEDSKEFFSPPLPYLVPAILLQTTASGPWAAVKIGQIFNVFLSLATTYTLLKICNRLRPGEAGAKLATLGMLGILPVYYKTFAYVRGEPFVALFTLLSIYFALQLFTPDLHQTSTSPSKQSSLILFLGICLGLGVLSRQWGFFLFPALAVFVVLQKFYTSWSQWKTWASALSLSFAIAFLVGGWFYLSLFARYGTVTAFNRAPQTSFSFSNQPAEFYTGLGLDQLFTLPVRSAFPNQFFPIFYSELWGDYWGYFVVAGRDTRTNELLVGSLQEPRWSRTPMPDWFVTNKEEVAPYLGRVNLLALLPSLLLFAGLALGLYHLARFFRQANPTEAGNALLTLILLASLAGYFWFLVRYPNPGKGDTIKASYMLHIFPILALLAGQVLHSFLKTSSIKRLSTIFILTGITLHNLPAMITHYIPWNVLVYSPPFSWLMAYLPWH